MRRANADAVVVAVALAIDERCLTAASIVKIGDLAQFVRMMGVRSLCGRVIRPIAEVEVTVRKGVTKGYYADAVTGSLYDKETGACLTASTRVLDVHAAPPSLVPWSSKSLRQSGAG
jgi:hypothetical protein